ncbi:MAG: hypothetical protein E4H10_13295 [Bacteroidia bacterium]|nr:MAG: hypothetical protein E4H10_13295 [Bacteroidia bacterium]
MKKVPIAGAAIILAFLVSVFSSCAFNSEEDLYGIVECDISIVTWENPIKEILAKNCVPCHNVDLHYNGVRHDIYELELIVVNDGRLNGVVNHLPGYPQMPYQLPQLPECERLLINIWIEQGAPEN